MPADRILKTGLQHGPADRQGRGIDTIARAISWANEEDQMTDKTAIQRIKELDQERATLFDQAKEEALRRANQAVEDLNALGLNYRLVTGAASPGGKSASKKPQETGGAEKKRATRPPG
jgi:hypothetical protein